MNKPHIIQEEGNLRALIDAIIYKNVKDYNNTEKIDNFVENITNSILNNKIIRIDVDELSLRRIGKTYLLSSIAEFINNNNEFEAIYVARNSSIKRIMANDYLMNTRCIIKSDVDKYDFEIRYNKEQIYIIVDEISNELYEYIKSKAPKATIIGIVQI